MAQIRCLAIDLQQQTPIFTVLANPQAMAARLQPKVAGDFIEIGQLPQRNQQLKPPAVAWLQRRPSKAHQAAPGPLQQQSGRFGVHLHHNLTGQQAGILGGYGQPNLIWLQLGLRLAEAQL